MHNDVGVHIHVSNDRHKCAGVQRFENVACTLQTTQGGQEIRTCGGHVSSAADMQRACSVEKFHRFTAVGSHIPESLGKSQRIGCTNKQMLQVSAALANFWNR